MNWTIVFFSMYARPLTAVLFLSHKMLRGVLKQLHSVMGAILEIDDAGNLAVVDKPLACRLYQ